MKKHTSYLRVVACICMTLLLLTAAAATGVGVSKVRESSSVRPPSHQVTLNAHPENYTGWVRLYMVEPVSPWKDNQNRNFHFGFLSFALDSAISIPDGSRCFRSYTWNAWAAGFWNTHDTNIMVIGALFNDEPHQAYSAPPSGSPFWAYYTDATAGAEPGQADSNHTTDSSTHTVLVTEASTSWCPNCPVTSYYLHSVYLSGNYNFYSVAMVLDKNSNAANFMDTVYNTYYVPTCYTDGGDSILIGGYSPQGPYQQMVRYCEQRAVADVGIIVNMEVVHPDSVYQVNVAIAHGTPVNTGPDDPPAPAGPSSGYTDSTYEFVAGATDPDSDLLYYRWSWGEGDTTDWLGPFDAGVPCTLTHVWTADGMYDVTFQTRDVFRSESGWSTATTVAVTCCINRGNVDGQIGPGGAVDVADLTYLVAYLFQAGAMPPCEKEGNVDSIVGPGGQVDVADLTYLVAFLFQGGSSPPPCD
ncbi:MAG: hypothetical protein AB1744_03455 [Candidatus Zixiibacteriota bacterium]